jgi:hypothetical protein
MDSQHIFVQRMERINNYQREYMRKTKNCEYCNREYKLFSYYRHCKTPKHLKNKKIYELENIIEKSTNVKKIL